MSRGGRAGSIEEEGGKVMCMGGFLLFFPFSPHPPPVLRLV